jgi:hypothetical protein
MEPRTYKVRKLERSRGDGYRLEGPGLEGERIFRSEESRERLQDIADLMNFAFEEGLRVSEASAPSNGSENQSLDLSPAESAEKMPGMEKEGGNLLRGMPRQSES